MVGKRYSVIMSVYDKVNPEHLEVSINSILNQTYLPSEFILVKDGRLTCEQENVIEKAFQEKERILKVIQFETNKGAGEAYNAALKKCSNEYAAIIDSDDYAVPQKFEKQMEYLKKHRNIDVIGSNAVEFIDNIDNIVSYRFMPERDNEIKKFAHKRCPMIQPTAIFKVKAVLNSGSYRKSKLTEDYDLYIRMIQNGCKFYTYQEVLYYVRTSEDFFMRRGGLKYLKPILGFKFKHFRRGFFSLGEFLYTSCASLIVALMPNFMRTAFYKKFLRG